MAPAGLHCGVRMLLLRALVVLPSLVLAVKISPLIERTSDHKDFKKLLRTRNNVLVLYSKSEKAAERQLKLLSEVAQDVKGRATISWVDCGDAEGKKLCKKLKVDPSNKGNGIELLHYKDGTFHMEYNRMNTYKSMVAFLRDPAGAPLWEENPSAKDVVHIDTEKDFHKLLKKEERPVLMMFYAPWCGVCKKVMPAYELAATELKGDYVLAGMNVHPPEFERLKEQYEVKGYPTILYFLKGRVLYSYEEYAPSAQDIVAWMKNPKAPAPPAPEVPWPEQETSVHHLTQDSYEQFVQDHPSVLLMFYAPWCGHCKSMKPDYEKAAQKLHAESGVGVLAAVDGTANVALSQKFNISGFPTLKFIEKGEEKYTVSHLRTEQAIVDWMHNPVAPAPPEPAWEERQTSVIHLLGDDFREVLKKKKHALVMFYAPWCPHCKTSIPDYTAAAEQFKDDRKIAVAAVDCTKPKNKDVCKDEGIKGFPTFQYYNYGKFTEAYSGERDESGFTEFIRSLRERDHVKLAKKKEEL